MRKVARERVYRLVLDEVVSLNFVVWKKNPKEEMPVYYSLKRSDEKSFDLLKKLKPWLLC